MIKRYESGKFYVTHVEDISKTIECMRIYQETLSEVHKIPDKNGPLTNFEKSTRCRDTPETIYVKTFGFVLPLHYKILLLINKDNFVLEIPLLQPSALDLIGSDSVLPKMLQSPTKFNCSKESSES